MARKEQIFMAMTAALLGGNIPSIEEYLNREGPKSTDKDEINQDITTYEASAQKCATLWTEMKKGSGLTNANNPYKD